MTQPESKEEVLIDFLQRYTKVNGYPPSTREMASAMGFRSVESIHRILRSLKEQGRVTWVPHKARTLKVVE